MVPGEWKRPSGQPVLLVLGMNPGRLEVNMGRPFVGPSGAMVREALSGWKGAIYATNAVLCGPRGVTVGVKEVECCLDGLLAEVQSVNPDVILSLGEVAKSAVVRLREKGLNIPVIQLPHPAMALRGGLKVRAWIDQCMTALSRHLIGEASVSVFPGLASCPYPKDSLVGADSEYPYKSPPWAGEITMYAISDGKTSCVQERPAVETVFGVLNGRKVVFHDAVNELMVLMGASGGRIPDLSEIHDTMVLAYLEHEECSRDLKVLAANKLGYVYKDLAKSPTLEYAAHDARATRLLYDSLRQYASSPLYGSLYQPLFTILAGMGYRGLNVDVEAAAKHREKVLSEIDELDRELRKFAVINWNSNDQVSEYFRSVGADLSEKTDTGKYEMSRAVLVGLADKFEEARLLLRRRELVKLDSTYLSKLVRSGGVVRTIYNIVGTETGRISSGRMGAGMNLQNIPKSLRYLFVPPDGMLWCKADFSQMELRVAAYLAERHLKDRPLTTAILMTEDFYRDMAVRYFGRDVSKRERDLFKTAILAAIYMATPGTLVSRFAKEGIDMSKKDAESILSYIYTSFPTLLRWWDSLFSHARKYGYVETPLGRRRHVMVGPGGSLSPEVRRELVNAPCQGTASDFCLRALIRAVRAGMRPLVVVHDEICLAVYPDEVEDVVEELKRIMEDDPILEGEPYLKAEIVVQERWGTADAEA